MPTAPGANNLWTRAFLAQRRAHSKEGILMTNPDVIASVESEGVRRTEVRDWSGARAYFQQALTFDMPALRQAEILRNVVGTYLKEGNVPAAVATAEQAIKI